MFNHKRKTLLIILFIFFNISTAFTKEQIATTYQTTLTPTDMVEIFLETIDHYAKYAYQIWDYEVYTKSDQQNYAWSVYISEEGYTTSRYYVKEFSVYLYLTNGFISFHTFGGPTTLKSKECLNAEDISNFKKIYRSCKSAIINYRVQGEKWLKRYKRSFSENEINALNKLCGIIEALGHYSISEYTGWFDDYSFEPNEQVNKITSLTWTEVPIFSNEITEDSQSQLLHDKGLPYFDYPSPSVYSFYIEDILKQKKLPLFWHGGNTEGLENFFNLSKENFDNIKTTKKDNKLYYLITTQKLKIYRYVDDKILKADDDLYTVYVADMETKKIYNAYYTDEKGIIFLFDDK